MMSHRPRKRFGQNFLQNQAIINTIVHSLHLRKDDNAVEIGPGLGAITELMLDKLDNLTAIEIDRDLQEHLREKFATKANFHLIGDDALNIDYSQFGNNLRLIGNLPYNISTPLLIKLLHYSPFIQDMHFMLQKEVADRLSASSGNKNFGRLSVMVQCFYNVHYILDVPANAFYPEPKVQSAIVSLTPIKNNLNASINFLNLEKIVTISFAMRRKTFANNLKKIMSAADILALGIDPTLRPEQLNIENYIQLAKFAFK